MMQRVECRPNRHNDGLRRAGVALFALSFLLSACDPADDGNGQQKVNGSVHVPAGHATLAAQTVNGGIDIDANATVTTASTVNGGIRLGDHATAEKLKTVNGNIHLGAGARVANAAESVNGAIDLDDGAEVRGEVRNVNGDIKLRSAHVAGGIRTTGGSIYIGGASHVENGVVVERTNSLIQIGKSVPRVEILPGAVVQGQLRFEREVKLYVSDRATIGSVTGATPITFTGDSAPSE